MRKNMAITENYLYQFVRQLYAINTDLYFEIKVRVGLFVEGVFLRDEAVLCIEV